MPLVNNHQPLITIQTETANLEVQIDGQTADSWNKILVQFTDANIYQSWAYGAVRWGERNLSHLVIRQNGAVLAAAQLRIVRVPLLPAGIAYLRWGPLCHPIGQTLNQAILNKMIAQLGAEYAHKRGLALHIIPAAYLGNSRGDLFTSAFRSSNLNPNPSGSLYQTIMVDLSPPSEILRKKLDQKWRNQLNRSERNGLVLEVSEGSDAYRAFAKLYLIMWERKRFATSVDVNEFGHVQARLPETAKMHVFLAKKDGHPVAGLVCSLMGNTAIYLLGATNEEARELKAAYYLQWQAMLWLKEHGAEWYDLGGIDLKSNPGGHHFKSGFSGTEVTQLPTHSKPGSALSKTLVHAMTWLRRSRRPSRSSVLCC